MNPRPESATPALGRLRLDCGPTSSSSGGGNNKPALHVGASNALQGMEDDCKGPEDVHQQPLEHKQQCQQRCCDIEPASSAPFACAPASGTSSTASVPVAPLSTTSSPTTVSASSKQHQEQEHLVRNPTRPAANQAAWRLYKQLRRLIQYGTLRNFAKLLGRSLDQFGCDFRVWPFQCTLLMVAAQCGREDIVSFMLDLDDTAADVSRHINTQSSKSGDTALHKASYFDHPGVVRLLLHRGGNPRLRNLLGEDHHASRRAGAAARLPRSRFTG
jgi:hypothetical protein